MIRLHDFIKVFYDGQYGKVEFYYNGEYTILDDLKELDLDTYYNLLVTGIEIFGDVVHIYINDMEESKW